MNISELPADVVHMIRRGCVIPAHPLALDTNRRLSEPHQRALTRYYLDAGAGGVAVGVHTTQFEIRHPDIALFKPVLELAAETIREWEAANRTPVVRIAGICGRTPQAMAEAAFACDTGYHAGLLSLAALAEEDVPCIIAHCKKVAEIMPLIGFYLQPAVGGRELPYVFWREFAEIDNVIAIKMAPFNRYQTIDVVRAVCDAGREGDISLYTGNDDNIVVDLLTEYRFGEHRDKRSARIVGGLLGHWSVWTRKAVELLDEVQNIVQPGKAIPAELLTRAVEITDCNAAFFDAANRFAGCIAGLHEVLHRQGLMPGIRCLNPDETLSPGQREEIDRVYRQYPHLNDDRFVAANLSRWLT